MGHALVQRQRDAIVRIATINVRNFSDAKALKIRRIIEKHDIHITILTETNIKLNRPLAGRGKPLTVIGEAATSSGVAVVYEATKMKQIDKTTPRLIELTLKNGIHIIGAYGPTEQAPWFEQIAFWGTVKTAITSSIHTHPTTILIGDLNAGHEKQRGVKKINDETNYKRMKWATGEYDFDILATAPTWKSDRSTQPTRTLDRCLIHSTTNYSADAKLDWECNIGDHAILIAAIKFHEVDRNIGRSYTEYDHATPEETDAQWYETKRKLKQLQPQQNTDNRGSLQQFWEAYEEEKEKDRLPLIILDPEGNELEATDAVEACATYLRTVWNKAAPYRVNFRSNYRISSPPTLEEVTRATQELRKDTAVGRDKIPSFLIKNNLTAIAHYFDFFQILWETPTKVPKDWKDMKVRPILKRSKDCSQWS